MYEVEGKVKLNDGIGIEIQLLNQTPKRQYVYCSIISKYNFKYPNKYIFSKSFYLKPSLYGLSFDDLLYNKT